jgi:nitrogen fixation protein
MRLHKQACQERVPDLLKEYAVKDEDSTGQKVSLRYGWRTKYVRERTSPASAARINEYDFTVKLAFGN